MLLCDKVSSDSSVREAAAHTEGIITQDEFAAFIFSHQVQCYDVLDVYEHLTNHIVVQ